METNVKKGLALVLANANYQTQNKLPSCKKDGLDMNAALSRLNFDVLFAEDTTRSTLYDTLNDFITRADSYSTLLVYYTGHGVQIDGENYFVPIDCTYNPCKAIFIATQLVGINVIVDYMNSHPDKTNIIILDACRDCPPFTRSMINKGLAEIKAGAGTFVAFATSPNMAASCPNTTDENGYYTKCLLDHLETPNIKIEDMFKAVRRDVITLTHGSQIPWENTSLNYDFYFSQQAQNEINEYIYQSMRNFYSANTLISLAKKYEYTLSDTMRIYEKQKSEKPGGIHFKCPEEFERYILSSILDLGFDVCNYRWIYNGTPVIMGEFFHNPYLPIRSI